MPSWAAVWMRTTTSSEGTRAWAGAARACRLFVETVVGGEGGVTLIVGCRPHPRLGPLVVIGLGVDCAELLYRAVNPGGAAHVDAARLGVGVESRL